jgi:hypothetical protein
MYSIPVTLKTVIDVLDDEGVSIFEDAYITVTKYVPNGKEYVPTLEWHVSLADGTLDARNQNALEHYEHASIEHDLAHFLFADVIPDRMRRFTVVGQ